MKNRNVKRILSLALAVAVCTSGLITGGSLTARAATPKVTIDLSNINTSGVAGQYDYYGNTISVTGKNASANDIVHIKGDGTNNGNGYNIVISEAQNITIAEQTKILSNGSKEALSVPDGANITGEGDDITITGRDGTNGKGGNCIVGKGNITISGKVGNVTGGNSINSQGGHGISSTGDVTISGTVGNVTGGNSNTSQGGHGISSAGDVTISGTVGNVTGGNSNKSQGGHGISSAKDVTISGTVGSVTGGNSNYSQSGNGILAKEDILILGKTGTIKGGMYTESISAASYAVFDYNASPILDHENCNPVGYRVNFNYGTGIRWLDGEVPRRFYTAPSGGKIPPFAVPAKDTRTVEGWYTKKELLTPWNFATETVDGSRTLYAKWSISAPSKPKNLMPSSDEGQITLYWGQPEDDGGSPITRYEVKKDDDAWIESTLEKTYIFPNLTPGTRYTFKVRAVNICGAGAEAETTAEPREISIKQKVEPTALNIQMGSTASFNVFMGTGTNKADSVSIVSNNPAVATVDKTSLTANGTVTVTGVAEGSTTVTLGWSGGSKDDITDTVAVTVTAKPITPATKYTITATASTGGTVTGGGSYGENETARLFAAPNTGYKFVNWTENGVEVSPSASYDFVVIADRVLVANFKAGTVTPPVDPPVDPPVTPPTTYSRSSDSSVGSNKADTSPNLKPAVTGRPFTKPEATKLFGAALAAKPAGQKTLSFRAQNYTSAQKAAFVELAVLAQKNGITLTVHFDTVVRKAVTYRLSVNPALVQTDLDLTAKLAVGKLTLPKFAVPVEIAVKMPAGVTMETLKISENGKDVTATAKPWLDKVGYLHFITTGGEMVLGQ